MFLVDKKLQKTKLTLCLLALLHSAALQAELHTESQALDSRLSQSPQDSITLQDQPGASLAWPLLPGESVNSLAALFYPHNKIMQARFVTRTIQLNEGVNPGFNPATVVNLVTLIMVPDLKALGKSSGKIHAQTGRHSKKPQRSSLRLSYQLKDADKYIVTPKMQAEYESLVVRNASLKAELEALNAKLAQLQQILAALKEQALLVVKRTETDVTSVQIKTANASLALEPHNPTYIQAPVVPQPNPAKSGGADIFEPTRLWILCLILLSAIGLLFGWRSHAKRQEKALYRAATGEFDPLKTGIFNQVNLPTNPAVDNLRKLDFALTDNGISNLNDNISVVDLSGINDLDFQEEGELILEQARIYLNIGRVDEAITLLKVQIRNLPKESLHQWLYLLDIYRDHNRQEDFLQYAKQLHETFNVMLPLWGNATVPIVTASSLEEFPHIVHSLTGLWPESAKDAKAYIDELIMDNRHSERAGFSMEVFQELVLLRDLLVAREKLAA